MPAQPETIKLSDLDAAIRAALKTAGGGKLGGIKGPIINGIIATEAALKGANPLTVAKEITAAIPGADVAGLKAAVTKFPDGKILLGYQLRKL
jgi:hypothetical protein